MSETLMIALFGNLTAIAVAALPILATRRQSPDWSQFSTGSGKVPTWVWSFGILAVGMTTTSAVIAWRTYVPAQVDTYSAVLYRDDARTDTGGRVVTSTQRYCSFSSVAFAGQQQVACKLARTSGGWELSIAEKGGRGDGDGACSMTCW